MFFSMEEVEERRKKRIALLPCLFGEKCGKGGGRRPRGGAEKFETSLADKGRREKKGPTCEHSTGRREKEGEIRSPQLYQVPEVGFFVSSA